MSVNPVLVDEILFRIPVIVLVVTITGLIFHFGQVKIGYTVQWTFARISSSSGTCVVFVRIKPIGGKNSYSHMVACHVEQFFLSNCISMKHVICIYGNCNEVSANCVFV
uniref:Uncharacterized protein n=1 Tax=Cacopsylla melanoneura TaxID=428564 RepID=A0A8D9E7L8_9HEMI